MTATGPGTRYHAECSAAARAIQASAPGSSYSDVCRTCWSQGETEAGQLGGPEVLAAIADRDTYPARSVTLGWDMAGVGAIETVTTHAGRFPGQASVTFSGPQGHRTFKLDSLVEATAPAGQEDK